MPDTSKLRAVQIAPGLYALRRIVTPQARDQLRQVEPEREPLTWEEYLSLPAEQRDGSRYP
jgi:hypothetical protein